MRALQFIGRAWKRAKSKNINFRLRSAAQKRLCLAPHVTAIFIRILVCNTLTDLRCDRMPFFTNIPWPRGKRGDTGRFPVTKRFRKIPVGNVYRWRTCSIWHSHPIYFRTPFTVRCISRENTKWRYNFCCRTKTWTSLWMKRVSLIQMMISFLSWRGLQPIWGAIFTEIKVFNENILPACTVDEFESIFELLCREVQATGRVPQQHAFGRPPIALDKQVLAFVWFIANSVAVANA